MPGTAGEFPPGESDEQLVIAAMLALQVAPVNELEVPAAVLSDVVRVSRTVDPESVPGRVLRGFADLLITNLGAPRPTQEAA